MCGGTCTPVKTLESRSQAQTHMNKIWRHKTCQLFQTNASCVLITGSEERLPAASDSSSKCFIMKAISQRSLESTSLPDLPYIPQEDSLRHQAAFARGASQLSSADVVAMSAG